ncbi:MAG: hypothetical protein ACLR0U_30110 [Enterocloster clostridioformis]
MEENAVNINKRQGRIVYAEVREEDMDGRLAAALTAAAMLVLAGAFVSLADESGDTTRFVSGTKVNGVGVGGLTVDEAKARIEGWRYAEWQSHH